MEHKYTERMKASESRRKVFILLSGLLLAGSMASAQVFIEGSVYGGGNLGEVTENTSVTVNNGTIGKKIPLIDRTVDQNLQLHSRVEYGNVYGGGNGFVETGTHEPGQAPNYDIRAGLVRGNTTVLIRGNAVVRRAVYGGGNMASVGNYTEGGVYAPAEGTGQTKVTITGNALIGPKKDDLTNPTDAERDQAALDFGMSSMTLRQYIDTAFRYLGSNEGWVFGSSRGLAGDALKEFSFVDTTAVIINGNAQAMNVFGSGENGHVLSGTFVNIAGNAIIGGVPLHNTDYVIPSGSTYSGVTVHLYGSDGELVEDEFGVGRLVTRGNVLGGGKGSDFIPWLANHQYSYSAGRTYGNATVKIEDNALIYNRVFGGGLLASVGTFTEDANHAISGIEGKTGNIFLTIEGGTIGSPGSNGLNNGEVYGGGRGIPGRRVGEGGTIDPLHQALDLAYVGNTFVTVDGGTILNNVYGGAASGHVQGDSHVTIEETNSSKPTTIGLQGVGGWHGNVFAGGGGTTRYKDNNTLNLSITSGRVFGDTYLEMTGGHVLYNVYGGGAIASVGTYDASEVVNPTHPYLGHGHTKITITGGEIGTNGDQNGMVFGSGRGQIAEPGNFLDYVTYVAYSEVNIGTGTVNGSTGEVSDLSGNAKINGSVYGSGENGHAYLEAVVNVFSGTIGCTADEFAAMAPMNDDKWEKFSNRGNVYGAGCGTDKYDTNNDGVGDTYNPLAGVVQGNTKVNIYGGYISRNVYGAGAIASVGLFTMVGTQHTNTNNTAALSWPYELSYTTITDANNVAVPTGRTEVNVRGGHIGTVAAPVALSGNVFGSARGDVGPLGTMEKLAIVKETFVNVNFAPPTGNVYNNNTPNVIVGSVYGSGENGSVYNNTKVTLTDGLVAGSVFGGGDGTDTYMVALLDPEHPGSYLAPSPQRSITSGKVYGNTEVFINGGTVRHNVFGGGNLASVGKGNYMGYGELTSEEPTEEPYQNSGICTVTVTGGTIGTTGYPNDGYNNGFVFGSSKGTVFKTINLNPRYDYSRDFFLGYTNKTIVNIGDPDVATAPVIKGSVFGGGDNGHVRWHTDVTVNKGEIGEAYVVPATYPEADSVIKWAYRGNVYGAGRGADMYDSDGNGSLDSYCPSAGSVTLNTNVTVNGGTIHRNVYGGGSMATVGPPPTGYDPGNSKCTVNIYGGTIGEVVSSGAAAGSLYGGHVYGAGRGIIDQLAPLTQYAAAVNTEVNVQIGNETDKVIGNVYGGGSYGQVKEETNVNMKAGHVKGSVFGGGMGFETEVIAGLVAGNATVDMTGGTIERSIYGGGQMGSVGTFNAYNNVTYNAGQSNAFTVQVPTACEANTGLTTVKMSGGNVGLLGSLMPWGDHNPDDDDRGWIFCGGQGLGDSITYPKAIAMGVVGSTYLEISNPTSGASPLVTASVYGGCENGLVLNNTHVKIAGGQIGTGLVSKAEVNGVLAGTFDTPYSEIQWNNAIAAVQSGIETDIDAIAAQFHECDAWEYGRVEGNDTIYYVYDIYAEANGHPNNNPDNPDYHTASLQGSNGHSFFGNVFGGGSGYYPIAPGVWRRTAGQVNGNTHVEITGGHILTNIYGGNETTDVKGKCTIEMSGGTLGVPRTIAQIKGHPVTCYLFGAGMGDTRTEFNKWTHVDEVEVSITGGTIFGSIFGGGEDGHVLGDVAVNVGQAENKTTLIGTWGRSYVDGNVFGGGRGFSGHALTAGVVMGNVDVNISGGTMLGSIYGGGRLASVGTRLVEPTDPQYGQLIPDNGDDTHGHVTINITGGTIGNDYEAIYHTNIDEHTTGGNVFAGAMGRLTNLDNSTNSLWPNLGKVKETFLSISGDNTLIKGNVYGGGEFGTVETDATITVSGGTIMRDVYGGGYGSTDITSIGQLRVPNGSSVTLVPMTPMKLAGRVNGNTEINIEGGWIQKSVYGGGEMATVGVINDSVAHTSETTQFALSWPYKMNYKANTGKTEINVTGGRIGITGSDYMGPFAMINGQLTPVKYNDQGNPVALTETEIDDAEKDNGDVYGGGKGIAAQRYLEAHATNVHDTHITINYTNNSATPTNYKDKVNGVYSHDCIAGAVYGGGENGHVIQNTNITLTDGLVGHNVYGGGKGKGTFTTDLWKIGTPNTAPPDSLNVTVYSITAGKVYGNTHVNMGGGYVVRNIFGGGNMASVGKGNYTGAPDDYSTTGYGECVTTASAMADTLNSGNTFVTITGGQLGYLNPSNPNKVIKDGLPYGSVYGGCRGEVSRDVPRTLSPRIYYCPEDFLGYVNKTHVVIGSATGSGTGPRLYGSVYGGGQDGHVRWNTNITFNKGEIGVDFGGSEKIANDETIQNDPNSHHWANRGNVYGAGSGISQYTDANNVKHFSYISGSVTQFTNVEIKGGTIHNNVYGGGNLATVGPPRILQPSDCPPDKTGVTVSIKGNAEIGKNTNLNAQYGGKVYGASRGIASDTLINGKPKYKDYAYCSYTEVNVSESPIIYGAVFGGGENGKVGSYHENRTTHVEDGNNNHTSTVNINGGTIYNAVYGGGQGVFGDVIPGSSPVAYYENDTMSGRVMGNATVNLMGGTIGVDDGNYAANVYGGCRRSFVWGNTLVNVGNRVPNREDPEPGTEPDPDPYTYYGNLTIYGSIFGANRYKGTPYGDATVNVYKTAHTADNKYPPIPQGLTTDEEILAWLGTLPHDLNNFAIEAVFGGSDLVDYTPRVGKKATVNVFQCDENTVRDVYGGGNAAAIGSANAGYQTDAYVNIYGGRFYRVFGGGNGEVSPADVYGTANTTIDGGLIYNLFGGGNSQGTVYATNLVINENGECPLYINSIFGGGNIAPIIGDVVTTVECGEGSYDYFYGGSNFADIYGNVTVNIFGGTYNRLFGGSRGASDDGADIRSFPSYAELLADYALPVEERQYSQSLRDYMHFDPTNATGFANELVGEGGNVTTNLFGGTINEAAFGGSHINGVIHGKIQVNVFDASNCGLDLEDLYGAGCDTPYEPIYALEPGEEIRISPEVNIIHGTVKGNVFGGGQGLTANTVGTNPVVNMGYYDAMGTTSIEGSLIDRLVDTIHNHAESCTQWNVPDSYTAIVGRDYTNIEAYNGKGNIYGGGELAQVTDNTSVYIHDGRVIGSVYGGGKGQASLIVNEADTVAGRVRGNTLVDMTGGLVERSIYGGGELGSVGTFTEFYNTAVGSHVAGEPKKCKPNTGFAKVRISGGQVGKNEALMPTTLNPHNDEYGYVFCGGKGVADSLTYPMANLLAVVDRTRLEISNTTSGENIVKSPLVTASVYGGSENGLVLGNTHVKMMGGQIGTGYNKTTQQHDGLYSESQWNDVIQRIKNGTFTDADAADFHECDHWPYGLDTNGDGIPDAFNVYDIYANQYDSHGGALEGSNGHTFFGNLFGGGSGFYPMSAGVWRRSAGRVWGNTQIDIEGGHILTSVYGANEVSDVMGTATVNMTGGTIGVPRTIASIKDHPVTCYLFGAGMGDPRTMFNTWTNVANAEVNISGNAFLFGSAFGGGEDGHVLGNVTMNIGSSENPSSDHVHIGTWGYSYVDGNVFGGGRGFDGNALTAGSVGGNVTLNIYSGTMLGSIYGGGRLASVGTGFTDPDDDNYGQMRPGVDHGNVRVNISGGTIGNDYESKLHLGNPALANGHSYGGNVYGGSMGRLTLLNGDVNPLWPNLGKVKNTFVTISGTNTIIKGSVYGGSELGTLSSNAEDVAANRASGRAFVKVEDGTIWRNVFGGSYGSDIDDPDMLAPLDVQTQETPYMVSPMQRAGRIDGNTRVEIKGGWVKKGVYGGGELASVGTITEEPIKHGEEEVIKDFALSWPYEFKYAEGTGYDTVIINNGRVGITGKDYMGPWNAAGQPIYYDETGSHVYDLTNADQVALLKAAREDNGDVFGGGKGKAGDRYEMAHCANSNNTVVIINYPNNNAATPGNYKPSYSGSIDYETAFYPTLSEWTGFGSLGCLPGAVYGGGENGHVNEDARVTLEKGLVGHNIYGGGKGTDTYKTWLNKYNPETGDPVIDPETGQPEQELKEITSLTAGKVYHNTYVTVNGGYVVRNVFGGGNRASVGIGNYSGGEGDYQENGYGEQWFSPAMRELLMTSGHTYVNVYGGQIGTVKGTKDDLPTGNVFGSSRGEPAPNVPPTLSPRYLYCPEFFSGYVNHSHVTIGENPKATPDENSPRLFGSVYGGGQDGHVRWATDVVVNDAKIGNEYVSPSDAFTLVGTSDTLHYQWLARGNVYGAGSGTGQYTDINGVKQYSNSSGSVTQFTSVTINGGLIHRNVYGGGSLASVGPPRIPPLDHDASRSQTLATVNINGTIGKLSDVNGSYNDGSVTKKFSYGGQVFGGSRGDLALDESSFSTSIYTEVNVGKKNTDNTIVPGHVLGNVYGGGEVGIVKQCTEVNMNAGEVGTIGYAWKRNTTDHTQPYDSIFHTSGGKVFGGGKGHISKVNAGLVKDSTLVNIKGGHVFFNVYGGGEMASVGESEGYTYTYTDANDQTISVQDYRPLGTSGFAQAKVTGGQVGPAPGTGMYLGHPYDVYIGLNGVDGYVFGGGEGIGKDPNELYKGFANVNYASVEVNMPMDNGTHANRLWGSIFGGGEDGHVLGSDTVRFVSGLMGTYGTTSYDGNIFGGGRNYSRTNLSAGRVRGNITVEMSGGQLYGSIFGGGRLGGTGIDYNGMIIPDEEGENGEKYGNVAVKVMGGKVGNDNLTNNPDNPNETLIETFTKYSMGDVYGGGKGSTLGLDGKHHSTAMLLSLTKNTDVEISQKDPAIPTVILGSVFGGGEVANVGTCTWDGNAVQGITSIEPVEGTGLAKVTVKGGRIGYNRMRMRYDLVDDPNAPDYLSLRYNDDVGHVFGGGQGMIADPDAPANDPVNPEVCNGDYHLADVMAVVFNSEVSIEDGWVKGSVYGGGLSGRVWWDTDVKIKGGLIGAGDNGTSDEQYDDEDFFNPIAYFDPLTPANNYVAPSDVASDKALAECTHWVFGKAYTEGGTTITRYDSFDPLLIKEGRIPSDGKTWFGNVFGGGSGYYPYVKKVGTNYVSVWNPKSGSVGGNTNVEITGGHILTSVYGGNELTDVGTYNDDGTVVANTGQSTVIMRNGTVTQGETTVTTIPTLGVPRTLLQIKNHPVTCYLFGAGKGEIDRRIDYYNKVASTDVTVSGGIIYGSIFGGGEEGRVLNNAETKVEQGESFEVNNNTYHYPIIGTTGRSYVDGNVFGGGRGFSGENMVAGAVGGNADVTISGGHMLGSIYGGGRLGSVGIDIAEQIVDPNNPDQMIVNPNYGEMQSGDDHGVITVTINGGTIGNDYEAIYHTRFDTISTGGNVFTGCMGRLTLLNNKTNPIWPELGRARETVLNVTNNADAAIAPPVIKGNVYGGGSYGTVAEDATIDISGGEIWRDVFGAGYGSPNVTMTADFTPAGETESTTLTPMQLAGRVFGNTDIDISGGWIKKCVYGGGEFASLGFVNDSIKHVGAAQLEPSWPFEFIFKENTGKADIDVTSGRIGITGKDFMGPYAWINGELVGVDGDGNPLTSTEMKNARIDNGDVYGGGKGLAGERYLMSHLACVKETDIYIHYADSCNADPTTYKNLGKGCVAGAVYGGGENGHVNGNTKIQLDHGLVGHAVYGGGKGKDKYKDANNNEVYSLTAGKVYGNTEIEINGGYVVRSVFGGGNLASVGKGNYLGYGENTTDDAYLNAAAESGHTYITIMGGTLGMLDANDVEDVFKDNIPYGSVFGGCRGEVVADEMDRFAHVNNTHVIIGIEDASTGPKLYGSVYGSAQDGHVRWNTETTVYSGEIGVEFNDEGIAAVGSNDPNSVYWTARGNVFGGGSGLNTYKDAQNQDKYNPNAGSVTCNTKVVVKGGNIRRDVYGGGNRAVVGKFSKHLPHPTSEINEGHTRVFIDGGTVDGSVFGGGNMSFVEQERVVTISDGLVKGDVYGGSNNAVPGVDTTFLSLKTVNVRGGHILGNVFGCSYHAHEGPKLSEEQLADPNNVNVLRAWNGFVNISGGTIDHDVYAAGNGGVVNGSLDVNIGATAIANTYAITGNANKFRYVTIEDDGMPTTSPVPDKDILIIGGDVYGGSEHYGGDDTPQDPWNAYDVNGYSVTFIDGTAYNTSSGSESTANYMNIGGGVFGSGKHCESGILYGQPARGIVIRNYGTRNPEGDPTAELTKASRALTTIQRGGIVLLENANINLTGKYDITDRDLPLPANTNRKKYGVLNTNIGLYVSDGSGIILGTPAVPATDETEAIPAEAAFIDSVKLVKSLYLPEGATAYNQMGNQPTNWEVIGIQGNSTTDARLYRLHNNQDATVTPDQNYLEFADENVIIFNDTSKMWVRYHEANKIYYGELEGFFRMRANAYDPYDVEVSFAYARPKIASFAGVQDDNTADGGFLSYHTDYNFYTDRGATYTNTNQHPYLHPYLGYRADHENPEYRLWVALPEHKPIWYVDGTRGWGHDDKSKKGDQAGLFPDKPKKTIFGPVTYDETTHTGNYGGIVTERFDPEGNPPVPSPDRYLNFLYSEDVIYVVGALTEFDNAILRDSITGTEPNEIHHPNYPLRLFRYPGGHQMSNGQYDNGAGGYAPNEHPNNVWGAGTGNVGPGANYGAMLNVKADSTITMKGVVMDGLYGNPLPAADSTTHMILPANNTYGVTNLYNPAAVMEPLVITNDNSTLSVGDSTVLMRGYNGTNSDVWYTDAFANRDAVGIQGGAMYVDTTATVNVSGKVYITDNKQYLKIGDADAKVISSNVYLPTFSKYLNITNTLFGGSLTESASKIGITSPMGNDDESYIDNTFSPVAVASNSAWAASAWDHLNFYDDLGWFFINENTRDHKRTTYYDGTATTSQQPNPINAHLNERTLFFGWTWANIVRANPGTNSFEELNEGSTTTFKIKDEKGLAWLISMTSGMNGVGASSTDFTGVDRKIKQTADVDLLQYVWVPIGSPAEGYNKSFAGNYDGQGHLIKNLYIEYIGIGDSIYERHDYGLFGYAFKGEVYRTFVVSGEINPVIANANLFNVGGLVGRLDIGKVSNSEAAVALVCPDESQLGYFAGGLIGSVQSSMVHSSMAMPSITVNDIVVDMPNESQPVHTMVGGLIGSSTATSSAEIRNSFVNALYDLKGTPEVGGLLGNNDHTIVRNCYVNWHGGTPASSVFKGVVKQAGTGSDIDYCYVKQGVTVENFGSSCGSNCFNYTPTTNADQLGYMYYDNLIEGDTTLMARLNINAKEMNRVANDSIYSYWARPGLAEINGDLPVLLLNEFDVFVTEGNTSKRICHQGNFRSLGTYAGGVALQYGGPVRDDNELKSALVREQDGSNKDCLFIYGDVRSVGADFEVAQITQDKVSIHEDVSIIDPGKLTEFANTYVGISFDNSCGHATSTPGINYGLLGMGGYLLPRDWHMFSSPLSNAPLGFNYGEEDNEPDGPSNNPWESIADEFNWLTQVGSDECSSNAGYRYWMNTFVESDQSTDGYFPTRRGNLFNDNVNELFIVGDDECPSENLYRYPYGMDFYTWNEPKYHWINFKRNGPNHWHSDEPHNHLTYVTEVSTNHSEAETDINESKLISSKGYMAAITKETFMQSHGCLNNVSQSIMLTNTSSSKLPGWNLVGNPFHGYLDFNKVVSVQDNLDVLSTQYYDSPLESVFYVVYNADKYENENAGTAFRYYPVNGSRCGEYAERYLHPHQGFYVKAKDNLPLEFNKDMLVTRQTIDDDGAESHFRDERPSYPLVNLYLSSDQGCADVTVIEFERPNWGGATKLKELRVGDGLFYAQHDDTHYAALFAQQGVDRVPLWFEAKEDDIFNIKWNTANGDFHSMYLIDNIAGVQYDMIRNNSYTFEGHKGDYPSRFLIVFNVTDVEENIELNSFVFFDGSQWMVTGEGQLEFIDLNGQVLWVKNVDGGQSRVTVPEVASGMYLFRLTNGKETKVQKVIVNR